jgi:hypothetical protein
LRYYPENRHIIPVNAAGFRLLRKKSGFLLMTLTDSTHISGTGLQKYLEFAVPLVSFGFTGAGILLWQAGFRIDFQYFAAGCLIGSCILAYLAWVRPRKDIVALSTPIYGIIFFVMPTDYDVGVILQLLYAFSLTLLLVRLKYRFGTAPLPGAARKEGPLDHYIVLVQPSFPPDPEIARTAALMFIRFAEGDYDTAARFAFREVDTSLPAGSGIVSRAFAIVAEQAAQTKTGGAIPHNFRRFVPEDVPFLFHPAAAGMDEELEYIMALDNALLLLYAAGMTTRDEDKKQALIHLQPFAQKLCGV